MAHVWMKHSEHGGKAAFPPESVEMWRLKGWEPTEAPADVDPAMVEHVAPSLADPSLPADEAGFDNEDEE